MDIKIAKIGTSIEADQSLDRMLSKINEGFSGGRVTKNDLTSWVILYFEKCCLDDTLDKVRKDHFDHVAYLGAVVKELKLARKNGTNQPNIAELLAPLAPQIKSISAQKKPRSEKSESQNNSIGT